ncbi:UPF0764 protein C16orf89 homolog isoform X1 [Dasypus novemcinctus]|uniref:UPF0764 protein C16orf89 homolog isoform X1 n=1 Tax=Dasypus novemcinctus TaxID=9361 RepID=UPI0003290E3F|nr:UPF0764 protein C16orf89 homolog isoform X2 [Dasypus novemcinctus]
MARPGLPLLLLLAVPPLQASSLPPPDALEGKATVARLILSAGERAAAFLEERLPELNLDAAVGFRVLEAQLQGVQEAWAHDPRLQPLRLRASKLAEKLAALLQRSLLYLGQSDPKYLREFQLIVQPGFWKPPRAWAHTNASLVYPKFEPEDSFSEERSDLCLVQLLGTGAEGSQPCRLSDSCRTLMATDGCSGYCLSHQLLFFLSARMKGCTSGLFRHSQHYMDLYCANMMDLNLRAEAIGYAYPTRDIFMENIMFCGLSGFSDFYKLRWLQAILSWQVPRKGCFGKPAAENEGPQAAQHQGHFLRRVKRREKIFTDGCSSHNTAVAVGALGGFLYALAEHPPTNGKPLQSTPTPTSS